MWLENSLKGWYIDRGRVTRTYLYGAGQLRNATPVEIVFLRVLHYNQRREWFVSSTISFSTFKAEAGAPSD
jgi:hypothetical protein